MNRYEQIKTGFDKYATTYQERFMDLTLYNASYDAFCALLPPNARLLEIGCGPGNITRYLLAARPDLRITATDMAPHMVQLAQINNPSVHCQVLDARSISQLSGLFDGIISGFCLPYLSTEDCHKLIADSAALLNTGGLAYFSTIEADAQHQTGYATTSNGKDTFYIWYQPTEELEQALRNNKLELLELLRIPYQESETTRSTHLIFIARKEI